MACRARISVLRSYMGCVVIAIADLKRIRVAEHDMRD